MNRREFLTWVGVGCIASSLPVAIAACSPEQTSEKTPDKTTETISEKTTSTATGDWQKVGSSADLDANGQLLAKKSPIGPVLVIGKSKDSNLIAVNPTCTHNGCTVEWKAASKKLVCPCHGSEFGLDGKVKKGPATKPIPTYTAKVEGDAVLVKKG
jgi:cytochrome b6-f complex iron-sulfur subunit